MKENRLEDFIKNPEISLWKLSIPMMLGMSVQAIYTLIDTAFIGRWVGWEALAGLGVVWALFIIMGITFGLGSGSTTVIAQSIGENDKKADSFAQHNHFRYIPFCNIYNSWVILWRKYFVISRCERRIFHLCI